jgi:tetratricopeptide (TPR) repeat protein
VDEAPSSSIEDAQEQEGADVEPPPAPSIRLHRYLEAFGRTGARLLRHAERGNAEAAYRLGVLLTCERRPQEAAEWLQLARDRGFDKLPVEGRMTADVAAEAAFEIGVGYEGASRPHAAQVFFKRAGECGNSEAAYRVGLYYAQLQDHWEAAKWFSRAAMRGHSGARREFAAAHRELSFSGVVPPSPDGAYLPMLGLYVPESPYSLDSPFGHESPAYDDPLMGPMYHNSSYDFPVVGEPFVRESSDKLPTVDELLQRIQEDRARGGYYGGGYGS